MIQRKFKIKDGVLLETTEVRIEDYSKLLKYNMNLRKLADDIRRSSNDEHFENYLLKAEELFAEEIEKAKVLKNPVFGSCRRSWQGVQRGGNTSAYWGFLALTLLCSSKNPLIGYGISRLVEISVPASASNPSYIAVLCTHRLHCDLFFMITGKLQWTDGLKEG